MRKGTIHRRKALAFFLRTAATCAVGCNTILGVHDLQSTDDAASVVDAGVDGGPDAAPSTVHGTAINQCYGAPNVATPSPEDLSGYTIQAYVPDGSPSGFHIINGTGTNEGTFTIPDVDDGPYLLTLVAPDYPVPSFYETSSRAPDIGYPRPGKCAGVPVTGVTPVTFQLSGLAPWTPDDELEFDSFSGGVWRRWHAQQPAPGDTVLNDVTVDWKTWSPWLLEGGIDDIVVSQYRSRLESVSGLPLSRLYSTHIESAYVSKAPGLTSGTPTEVAAHLTSLGNRTSSYLVTPANWINGLDPQPLTLFYVTIRQRAGLTPEVTHSYYGMLSTSVPVHPQPYLVTGAEAYSDPFPADWTRYTVVSAEMEWPIASRSGHPTTLAPGGTFERRTTAASVAADPSIGAVHGIRVMGHPANRPRAIPFDGGGPVTVSWESAISANRYTLIVWRVNEAGQVPSVDQVATLTTSASSATMPAPLFAVGGTYAISIMAIKGSTDYAGGTLRRNGFPVSMRDAVTARLLFASSCGNGTADAEYEECDSSGVATASCNADCSRTRCGDAILNVAAGEVCDDGTNSFACDDDCTPSLCGDGHLNATTEACDDHNSISGDGCSAECVVESGYVCTGSPSACTL